MARVTLVSDEILGYTRTGGLGTATSYLAVALGRMGHDVELLYVGKEPDTPMAAEWQAVYAGAAVHVRQLPRSGDRTEPAYFSTAHDVELALAADPPDVVISQDLAAPAYAALRLRQLGLGFEETLFVVYCHGGRRWITDMARKVRVLPGAHAITLLEQASVELADVIVSPSEYLLGWMRDEAWQLPGDVRVIPHLTRAAAMGEHVPQVQTNGARVERLAFFGRLEERKGIRPFAAALNALPADLLSRVELEFVGAATPAWPRERVEALLSPETKQALRRITFETSLDQDDALERLSRPGTLAVMPSHGETFSNAVFECLERGIPFIASDAGAPRELVAEEDRARVLFAPNERSIEQALRNALTNGGALRPARAAIDPATAYDLWADVVATKPRPREHGQHVADEWKLVGTADDSVRETLARAQAACGADVVTCGVRLPSGVQRFFLGDPGGLGVLENHYGTVALLRHAVVTDEPVWPLLARLALDGATIVSIPKALAAREEPPADVGRAPAEAIAVARIFEQRLPRALRSLARLAAGLAAQQAGVPPPRRFLRRLLRR